MKKYQKSESMKNPAAGFAIHRENGNFCKLNADDGIDTAAFELSPNEQKQIGDMFTRSEVPRELDLRIIASARLRQGSLLHRRRKLRWLCSSAAAAAAICFAAGLLLMPEQHDIKKISSEEYARLSAMTDWSSVEQETYNLTGEVNFGSAQLADIGELRITTGV